MHRSVCVVVVIAFVQRAHADVSVVAHDLSERGNLRVALACADRSLVTPEDGLQVSVDGVALTALRENLRDTLTVDGGGESVLTTVLTDVGFFVTPGRHHVTFAAPGCAADQRELEVSGIYAERVEGRLSIADGALRGAAVAPDGFGFTIGTMATPLPPAVSTTRVTVPGIWLSSSIERRSWLIAGDATSGWSSLTEANPAASSGSVWGTAVAVRVGRRITYDRYALAAGTGIGVGVWIASVHASDPMSGMVPPDGATFDWSVPVWSAFTAKPACSWGVQALATYDVRPTNLGASSLALAIGLQWQPSQACSSSPGLVTSP